MSNYWDCALLWVSCQGLGLHIHLKFPGRGRRDAPVGDIYVVVELSVLLPGRRGRLARSEAARLLVRCYGGTAGILRSPSRSSETGSARSSWRDRPRNIRCAPSGKQSKRRARTAAMSWPRALSRGRREYGGRRKLRCGHAHRGLQHGEPVARLGFVLRQRSGN